MKQGSSADGAIFWSMTLRLAITISISNAKSDKQTLAKAKHSLFGQTVRADALDR